MIYKGKISVIVPVYNSQEYLEDCVISILSQSYSELEIIIVDDGSNDYTLDICKHYQKAYPEKIKVVFSEHNGVGIARNLGLANATGEYIAFVDSDDTIDKNMYKEMIKAAEQEKADIVVCDVMLEIISEQKKEIQYSINYGEHNLKNYMQYGINLCSPCNKLFHRSVFTNICFLNITYEDSALIPVLVSRARHLIFVKEHFYNYMFRKGSISNSVEDFRIQDFFDAITYSIDHVNPEYRDELIYWHARSIVNISNSDKRIYVKEMEHWVTENKNYFIKNTLISKDIYVNSIIENLQKNDALCAEETKYMLTIVTDLDKDTVSWIIAHSSIDKESLQVLPMDFQKQRMKIYGKFILILEDVIILPRYIMETLCTMEKIYGGKCNIFAVPKEENNRNNNMFYLEKDYRDFSIDKYIYFIKFAELKKITERVNLGYKEMLFYVLMKKPCIYVINQLFVTEMACIKDEDKNQKEDFEIQKRQLKSILHILMNSMSVIMGIPHYIQYYVIQNLRVLIETEYRDEIIQGEDFKDFKNGIQQALKLIEDKMLIEIPRMTPEHKLFIFNMKYEREADVISNAKEVQLFQNKQCVYIQDNTYTMLEFFNYNGTEVRIEGRTICLNIKEDEEVMFFAVANGKIYPARQLKRNCNRYCLGDLLYKGIEFEICIPIDKVIGMYKIKFFYVYRGYKVARKDIRFGKFFPLTKRYLNSYYKKCDRVLTYDEEQKQLCFRLCGKKGKLLFEKAFLRELKTIFNKKEFHEISKLRIGYMLFHLLYKRRIWLISDKAHRADDNGEAFFRYMNSNASARHKIKTYYLADKTNPDYSRIKRIGRIVRFNTFKHKMLSLVSEYHFIAYANDALTKPLLTYKDCFNDIMERSWIVFLQHGPTQNNISSALNKYNQNFNAIITVNEEEKESFINYTYYYKKEQIKLLGFPRYDYLYNNPQKYITIAPTWRRNLFGDFIQKEERYILKKNFKESMYYRFYSNIINSEKLHRTMQEYGYKLHFIPHPVFFPYIDIFEFNSEVIVHGADVSYNKMFAESNLFITDYSSAVFDCAYLEKPIIYTQFDREEFYKNQYEQGMFDYETEGFGPVVGTEDEAVNTIIEYIKKNCNMEEYYRKRVKTFFSYHDRNNSKRIFEEFI